MIFIDIDDFDGEEIDFSNMQEAELMQFLMKRYNVPIDLLPNWITVSGRGLHLYYCVKDFDLTNKADTKSREECYLNMITYFKADRSAKNKSRIARSPKSYNAKHLDNLRKTRLYHINTKKFNSLDKLNYFNCTEEDKETYRLQQN